MLLGALNWSQNWYRPGRDEPGRHRPPLRRPAAHPLAKE